MSYHQFTNTYGEIYGSFQTLHLDRFDAQDAGLLSLDPTSSTKWSTIDYGQAVECDPTTFEGWYWQAGWPGCIPDGDLMGPFPTEADAINDANLCA